MLSLYEILKASKTGIATDMWTALAGMNWGGKDSGAEVKELTGIPPLSIRSNGTILLDYLISGNMSQSGTPTPTTPIQPQECGDLETEGAKAGQYKIPISSANTTTPIYLGEVPTTRRIKKLVLTGQEGWQRTANGAYYLGTVVCPNDYLKTRDETIVVCTHYTAQKSVTGSPDVNDNCISFFGGSGLTCEMYIGARAVVDVETFKSYLQQQYANGTPVTVWYVLAEPTTGIVNEPLRKIRDYADTLSMEQAGVSIPTNNGSTTVDVETTLKPSEVYIKYKG